MAQTKLGRALSRGVFVPLNRLVLRKHPLATIFVLSVALAAIGAPCVAVSRVATGVGKPSEEQRRYESKWGRMSASTSVATILTGPKATTTRDVLDKGALLELMDLEEAIAAIAVPDGTDNTSLLSLGDLCMQIKRGVCYGSSVLEYWARNRTVLAGDTDVHRTVSVSRMDASGMPISQSGVMGNIVRHPDYPLILSASGFSTTIIFNNSDRVIATFPAWFREMERTLSQFNNRSSFAKFYTVNLGNIGTEVSQSIISDKYLYVIGFLVYLVLSVVSSVSSTRPVRTHYLVALSTQLLVILAAGASLGVIGAFVELSPLSLFVIPFLHLFLGNVNVRSFLFLYWSEFYRSGEVNEVDFEKRFDDLFSEYGVSMLVQFLVMALLGLIGLQVRSAIFQGPFVHIAVGSVFFFATHLLGIPSLVYLESEWRGAICVGEKYEKCSTMDAPRIALDEGQSKRILGSTSATFARMGILIAVVCCVIVSAYAISQMRQTIPISHLLPAGPRQYIDFMNTVFPRQSLPYFITVDSVDPSNSLVGKYFISLKTVLSDGVTDGKGIKGGLLNWYSDFVSWVAFLSEHSQEYNDNGNRIPQNRFYPWLNEFLSGTGEPHRMNIIFGNNGTILSSRMIGTVKMKLDVKEIFTADYNIRSSLGNWKVTINPALESTAGLQNTHFYNPWGNYAELFDNFSFAFLSVGIVGAVCLLGCSLGFIPNIPVVMCAFVTTVVSSLFACAVHSFAGLELNGVTIVNVVCMSILCMAYYCNALFCVRHFNPESKFYSVQIGGSFQPLLQGFFPMVASIGLCLPFLAASIGLVRGLAIVWLVMAALAYSCTIISVRVVHQTIMRKCIAKHSREASL